MKKLSEAQLSVLRVMEENRVNGDEWYVAYGVAATRRILLEAGFIEHRKVGGWKDEYRITEQGRAALADYAAPAQPADAITPADAAHMAAEAGYVYQTTTRPAWKGETVPADGYMRKFSANDPIWATAECAVYNRRLTAEEMYRYELLPFSDNAYRFAVDQRVIYLDNEDVYTVTAHVGGKYHLRHECGDIREYIRESQLEPVDAASADAQTAGDDVDEGTPMVVSERVIDPKDAPPLLGKRVMTPLGEGYVKRVMGWGTKPYGVVLDKDGGIYYFTEDRIKPILEAQPDPRDAELTRLRAAVAALTRERDALAKQYAEEMQKGSDASMQWATALDAVKAERDALRAALRPFAAMGYTNDDPDLEEVYFDVMGINSWSVLFYKDFHDARELFTDDELEQFNQERAHKAFPDEDDEDAATAVTEDAGQGWEQRPLEVGDYVRVVKSSEHTDFVGREGYIIDHVSPESDEDVWLVDFKGSREWFFYEELEAESK